MHDALPSLCVRIKPQSTSGASPPVTAVAGEPARGVPRYSLAYLEVCMAQALPPVLAYLQSRQDH